MTIKIGRNRFSLLEIGLGVALGFSLASIGSLAAPVKKKAKATPTKTKTSAHHVVAPSRSARGGRTVKPHVVSVPSSAKTARSIHLSSAFVASEQLRPMAQQLAATRSAASYSGVQGYAREHSGEGASAAYLALGHAFMLDRRYAEAVGAFRQAAAQGQALDDYADFLGAQAALQSGNGPTADQLLTNFAERHPDSIFGTQAPILLANAYVQQGNAQAALQALRALANSPQATHADYLLAEAKVLQAGGQSAQAVAIYRGIYLNQPLSYEATQAATQLLAMSMQPSAADRKRHADALFNAKRYSDASNEYASLEHNDSSLSQADRSALQIYAAVCDLKLKRLSRRDVDRLADTSDDSAALKLYLYAELSRNENDIQQQRNRMGALLEQFPHSRWTEEALYSGGNMYLLKHDSTNAIWHYQRLFTMFPHSTYAPSAHWRTAWLNYRMRNFSEAARLMEDQVAMYPQSLEASSALYWRGRLYEELEHNPGQAANFYRALSDSYRNYYYGMLARTRLLALSNVPQVTPAAALSAVRSPEPPTLVAALPENDVHLIKARLLANASLNDYIAPEIQASPTSAQWGTLAQAEIYASYGENWRALQAMKHSGLSFFAMPIDEVPSVYWRLLFPRSYWSQIQSEAAKNGVDPFLVCALIRQETEFNPGAVSRANAYGLMQMLPSVGKAEANRQGIRGFNTAMLLNPSTNIQLGVANLKHVLDRYNGQPEYVLAAYNAGDTPVRNWMATNDYRDLPEFVESIPYSETREYVQAVMRNREMYRQVYSSAVQ